MHRPLYFIGIGVVIGLGITWWAYLKFALQKGEVINCLGFLFLLASAMLLYYQVKSSLSFERRRTTHDFIHGPIVLALLPLEKQLENRLKRTTLIFNDGTTVATISGESDFFEVQRVLKDILNFYERMAIALRSAVLDEHMLYDDKGAVLISFYDWAEPLIDDFRKRYDPRAYVNLSALAAQWRRRYNKAAGHRKQIEAKKVDSIALPKRSLF